MLTVAASAGFADGEVAGCARASAEIVGLVARLRAEAGLSPLEPDSSLDEAATGRARQLRELGYLSHRGPDGDDALGRARRSGATGEAVGEVLGAGHDPTAVFAAWLASDPHREILTGTWYAFGLGVSCQRSVRVYVFLVSSDPILPSSAAMRRVPAAPTARSDR